MLPTVRLGTTWMLEEERPGMRLSGRDQAQVCGPGLDLGLKPMSVWVFGKESAVTTGSVSLSRSDLHPGHGPLQCPGVSGTGFPSEPRVSV